MDKQFDSFIMKRCEQYIKNTENITEERLNEFKGIYQAGFQDALKILQSEKEIEIHNYI